jgi:hypothetical protein
MEKNQVQAIINIASRRFLSYPQLMAMIRSL